VQRVVAARPELEGRALVLYTHLPRGGQQVTACSVAAYRHGVRIGMSLSEATALVEKKAKGGPAPFSSSQTVASKNNPARHSRSGECKWRVASDEPPTSSSSTCHWPLALATGALHAAHFQQHDSVADRETLVQLARWCEAFSPLVGLGDESTDLLLDVTGLGPLFGGEGELVRRVAHGFHGRRYTVQIAVADTIGTAWAMAHFGKTSSLIIPAGRSLAAIGPLPVAALRLPAETLRLLAELGIERIGQLLALPREGLASRLGNLLVRRLDQAAGHSDEVMIAERPPVDFRAEWSLQYPTHQRAAVEAIVSNLVARVAGLLAERDQGAVQLECRLDCGRDPVCVAVGLFQPIATASYLTDLLRLQLSRLPLTRPVAGVCVHAVITSPLVRRQGELFADEPRYHPRHLAALVDRLSSRLGRECVLRAQRLKETQPERAYRYVPLTGNRPRHVQSKRDSAAANTRKFHGKVQIQASGRPLRIHRPPLSLEVVAVAPDGPPARFRFQNKQYRIVRHWGPERIETGWWRGRSVRRDYYRVETSGGNRFWMFRQLGDGKWFLHGEFE